MPAPRFEYIEGVTADVTFRAYADDLDGLFWIAAEATASAMVGSLDSIAPTVAKPVLLTASELDLLLMVFLEELVFWKDAEQLLLRATEVRVASRDGEHEVRAELRGERIDPTRHRLEADVKAVTLAGLRVERTDDGWMAQVTLDV
ncbi:MAG TPA: archease [Candidatus Binatia bacterium]